MSRLYPDLPGGQEDEDSDVDVNYVDDDNKSPSYSPVKHRRHQDPSTSPIMNQSSDTACSRGQASPVIGSSHRKLREKQAYSGNLISFLEDNGWTAVVVVTCAFVILILGVYVLVRKDEMPTQPLHVSYEEILEHLHRQKEIFKSQDLLTWRTFSSVAKHVFNNAHPEYPGVILMTSRESAKPTNDCLLHKIRAYFENRKFPNKNKGLYINAIDLEWRNSLHQKFDLDSEIDRVIRPVSPFLAITNIEKLSPQAAMALHSYCDNTNAQYKEILYILQLNIPDDFVKGKLTQEIVEQYLRNLWLSSLGTDKVDALFARIANNVVHIAEESGDILKEIDCQ